MSRADREAAEQARNLVGERSLGRTRSGLSRETPQDQEVAQESRSDPSGENAPTPASPTATRRRGQVVAEEARNFVGERSLGRTRSGLSRENAPTPASPRATRRQGQGVAEEAGEVAGRPSPENNGNTSAPAASGTQRGDENSDNIPPPSPTLLERVQTALASSTHRDRSVLDDEEELDEIPIAIDDSDVHMRSHTTTDIEGSAADDRHAETSSFHGDFHDSPESDVGHGWDAGDDYVTQVSSDREVVQAPDEFATDDGPATLVSAPGVVRRNGRFYIPNFTCPQSGVRTTARIEGQRSSRVIISLTPFSIRLGRPAYTVKKSELGIGRFNYPEIDMVQLGALRTEYAAHGVPAVVFVAPTTMLNPTQTEVP